MTASQILEFSDVLTVLMALQRVMDAVIQVYPLVLCLALVNQRAGNVSVVQAHLIVEPGTIAQVACQMVICALHLLFATSVFVESRKEQ